MLGILHKELVKAHTTGDEIYDCCNHLLCYTHGIPCACRLREAISTGRSVTTKWLIPFWTTLKYDVALPPDIYEDDVEEENFWRELVKQVDEGSREQRNQAARTLYEQLNPQVKGLKEPVKERLKRGKGRPKGSKNKPKGPSQPVPPVVISPSMQPDMSPPSPVMSSQKQHLRTPSPPKKPMRRRKDKQENRLNPTFSASTSSTSSQELEGTLLFRVWLFVLMLEF